MLAMFFHDRQIERDLVERIQAIHIDDSYHTPSAHTFPDVEDQAGLLCAQSRLRFAGPDRKEVPLRHGCRMLDVESVIQHLCSSPFAELPWLQEPRFAGRDQGSR